MSKHYDLVLVLGYFRRLTYYFSIIRYLSPHYSIGLLPIPQKENLADKHKTSQDEFAERCVELGADMIEEPVSASVTVIPQQPYLPEAFDTIRDNVQTKTYVAAMAFAWAGLHNEFIEEFSIKKIYTIHQRFFDFLLQVREQASFLHDKETVEVGLPFKAYPVFEEFECDYLLAMPTPFSFPQEQDRGIFLETVLQLFHEIGRDAEIVHKPHNAVDYDYFTARKYRWIANAFGWVPAIRSVVKQCAAMMPGGLRTHFAKLYTELLYQRVLARTIPMEEKTPNHTFAMEAFLPGVRKGVIGGLSNTIWGALFFELPFYNCVDIEAQDRSAEAANFKNDAAKFLDLNLQFFPVPFCQGKAAFDAKFFDIVDDSCRQGDWIEALRSEIETAKTR